MTQAGGHAPVAALPPECDPEFAPDVVVVGGGLAGGLLALELAQLGLGVQLVDGAGPTPFRPHDCATLWSYGAIAPFAGGHWALLQRLHGDLGWRRHWFRPIGPGSLLAGRIPLPCSRVDAGVFQRQLPLALARAGVHRLTARISQLLPPSIELGCWRLQLVDGAEPLAARQVVLAAGSGCRTLWPQLPERLRVSWAGVLLLHPQSGGWPWAGPAGMRLPVRFKRVALEAGAPDLRQEAWQVDPGLLPWGDRWLAGQITLVRPGLAVGAAPDPVRQERRLRQSFSSLLPLLAHWPGTFQQVPVSFCSDGQPLVGPVAGAPSGLWSFTGFSAAFTAVPRLAPVLARAVQGQHLKGLSGAGGD